MSTYLCKDNSKESEGFCHKFLSEPFGNISQNPKLSYISKFLTSVWKRCLIIFVVYDSQIISQVVERLLNHLLTTE